jgi:hypothetical protein
MPRQGVRREVEGKAMGTRSLEELARTVARTCRRVVTDALERTHAALEVARAALDDARRLFELLAMDAPDAASDVSAGGERGHGDDDRT